uniref:Laminin G domain-containing protein n=1 Tax=Sphaeramia orbicularis TaxID=375764 RepID=A0A672Z8C2_9TELE
MSQLSICHRFVVAVSFYGDGSIHLRTVEASVQTIVHVRFRTLSQAGLLFLAAGRRDFLLLELISGRLQVRLDLGSGERVMRSEHGVHLSDLAWHSVELTHNRHNVTITVDRNSHTSIHIPGPDLELSVDDGLFVGGTAGFNHPYLQSNSTGFRGCMDEVVFNEHNLLSNLRAYSGYKSVHEVTMGCSLQFSATEEDPVSFFSSKAFMSLPVWEVPQEGVFECELQPSTKEADGLVLFSSGSQGGFVAIEIRDGYLVATVGNGEGSKTELHSLSHLHSNPSWYPIQLHLLPRRVQLKVGAEMIRANLSVELQSIQMKGPLFLGGLDEQARGEARRAGLLSAPPEGQLARGGGSFKGCLREIRVNGQRTGFPHATVTKDISVGCDTELTTVMMITTTDAPDSPGMVLTTPHSFSSNRKNPNFLMLRTLEVTEGGRAPLEPKHIKVFVNLDFRKLDIHPSQLMFRIEAQPIHGHLRLDLGAEEKDRTFSMVDLWQGRVMYVHSGSEDQSDFFMFSVFSSNKKELPVLLKGSRLHRFDISISPVNDAPVLSLPEGNLFTVLENSKRQVSQAEVTHDIYLAINLFSWHDLEEDKIYFVHSGAPTSRLGLRVSDGQKVTLEHKLVNNTGLEVSQGRAAVISTSHLAVQLNVPDQAVEVRYDIIQPPQYGELQRLHSSGDWKPIIAFSQKLLEKERIRYLNTYHGLQTHSNVTDHFKCKISIGSLATEEVVFRIVVHWIHFKVTRSKTELNGVHEAVFTSEDLHAISKGVKLNESELYFRLLTVPKKGQLYLDDQVLHRSSTFSQKNISDGLVKYELLSRVHDDTRDTFSFQVFSQQANSTSYDFRINIRAESNAVTVVNKGLSVLEGGRKVITKDVLFTHTASNREVEYSITASPRHGHIRRINLSNSTSINDHVVTFTNQDIMEERIMYVHDDSETKQDSFTFQILVFKPHKHTSKKEDRHPDEHMFNISVQLVNDQRPVRVVDKVFHVARDGQKLVTVNDLRYRDDDSDFEDSWLVYTRRGIPMGDLVLSNDTNHKLYEFTQRDLEQKKVLFVHRGVSFGRFVLFVTDGKHYVSTLLEVMAQDPYLQVENNTGLMVQRGGMTPLTSTNLSVFSNLDIRDPQEVTYEVFILPKHGVLCFNDKDRDTITEEDAISIFTQRDLVAGRLAYHHDGSHDLERTTERRSDAGRREVHLDIGVSVKIYLESHQRPPTVLSNSPLVVAEGHNATISKEHLEVVHEDSQPSEIVFTVQTPPSMGFLRRISRDKRHRKNNGDQHYQHFYQVYKFTPYKTEVSNVQPTPTCKNYSYINHLRSSYGFSREYISYIHDGSETLSDNFTIVANQTEIRKHSLPCTAHIDVIPVNDETPVVTTNQGLKVWVGSVTEISINDLSAEDSDSPPEGLEFVITPPSNGHLALRSAPSRHILNFTQSHIDSGQLVFVHSENLITLSFVSTCTIFFLLNDMISIITCVFSFFFLSEVNEGVILYDQNKPESVGWSAADVFTFTVSSPPAFLPPHTFTILVSFQANEHHDHPYRTRLLNNAGAVVAEGGRVTIDRSKLDASNLLGKLPEPQRKDHHIMYRVISLPQHGALVHPDFSQATLNKFGITYVHDDSETTNDSFTFRAWVAPLDFSSSSSSSSSSSFSSSSTFSAYSSDSSSSSSSFSPLYSASSSSPSSSDQVEDHDTPPEELHYLVISKPNNGYLTLGERPEPVTSFTQYDVNHGRLHFTQQVIKPSVSIVNNTGLSLVQGRTAVVLTTNQLAAQTNGRSQANVTYTVTAHPRHGRIAINDHEVTTFCHEDLQFGRVVYHMTDLSESEDSFQISVSAWSHGVDYGNVTGQTVNVTVLPLIYLREPVRVPSGIAVKLGKAMIDASELARISRVNPVFEVLSPPKHGKLVKVNWVSGMSEIFYPTYHMFYFYRFNMEYGAEPSCLCYANTYMKNATRHFLNQQFSNNKHFYKEITILYCYLLFSMMINYTINNYDPSFCTGIICGNGDMAAQHQYDGICNNHVTSVYCHILCICVSCYCFRSTILTFMNKRRISNSKSISLLLIKYWY